MFVGTESTNRHHVDDHKRTRVPSSAAIISSLPDKTVISPLSLADTVCYPLGQTRSNELLEVTNPDFHLTLGGLPNCGIILYLVGIPTAEGEKSLCTSA